MGENDKKKGFGSNRKLASEMGKKFPKDKRAFNDPEVRLKALRKRWPGKDIGDHKLNYELHKDVS